MGVTYSSESEESEDVRHLLRMTVLGTETMCHVCYEHHLPLFLDLGGLKSLMMATVDPSHSGMFEDGGRSVVEYVNVLWDCFAEDGVVQTKEFLVVTVLLCDAPWAVRLGLLFDVYKNVGTEDMQYDDVVLLLQTALRALHRLWRVDYYHGIKAETHADLPGWMETIATSIFLKLERDILKPLNREEFIQWGYERFKEGKTVATSEALLNLYQSPH